MPTTFHYTCEDCGKSEEYTRKIMPRKDGLVRKYCPECARSRQSKCALKHYHSNRGEINPAKKRLHKDNRAMVIERLGGKCECCGESEIAFLEVDHINDDGKEQRIKHPGQTTIYWWLAKHNFPPGFRLLCSNCNRGRWRNGGTCPHQKGSQAIAQASSSKRSEVPDTPPKGKDMVVSPAKVGAPHVDDWSHNPCWPFDLQ